MAECESISPENRMNQDKFVLPTHTISVEEKPCNLEGSVMSKDGRTEDNNANLKSSDVHLPNGVTRLSPDSNGLVSIGTECSPQKNAGATCLSPVDNQVECCCDKQCQLVKSPSCDLTAAAECNKSINQNIHELASDIKSLSVEQTKVEDERDLYLGIEYVVYKSELQMPDIMRLITKDLSEPYSIYTYRYFIHNWPKLCFLAMDQDKCVGAIVCKLDMHKKMVRRGYIAMLAVDSEYRRKKIGSHLVLKAIKAMIADDCDEVVLETEITNQAALQLYENLGFVRDKRLFRYYLNGVDALRLKLWLR